MQPEALGTANAVLAAEEFAARDEFLAINGDNYYPLEVLLASRSLAEPGAVLFEAETLVRKATFRRERIKQFAYAVIDEDGFLS